MNDSADLRAAARPAEEGRVEQVLRRGGVVELPPPPHLWEAVRMAVQGATAGRPPRLVRGLARMEPQPGPQTGPTPSAPSPRLVAQPRRTWSAGAAGVLAAAAVGALVTWAGLALVVPDTSGDVLASGQLEALTDDGTQGRAEVVDVDGDRRLQVTLAGQPDAADGYLEVWLLRPDVSGMVTLGVLEGTTGEFLLPEGLDLAEYAVVDISREHLDGDPAHGGDSLVRGQVG